MEGAGRGWKQRREKCVRDKVGSANVKVKMRVGWSFLQ
jgi:hypothetical protein